MNIQIYPPLSIHELGQRPNQEDSLFPDKATANDRLFVLCDGMGGHEHGEVASKTVCHALGTWFQIRLIPPLSKDQLDDALAFAYAQLDLKDDGEFKKMGTTLTLLFMDSLGVTALHMGDSRIYHIRPGVGILYQSRDHSVAFELYQAGEITYEEMINYPQKNIVTRAMTPGLKNRMRPDVIHITDIQPGDYFYMCSDGMLEKICNDELLSLLSSNATDEEKKQKLIDATKKNLDNHTAWLIHIKDVVLEDREELLVNEEPTARCNALNIEGYADSMNDIQMVDGEESVEMAEYDNAVCSQSKSKVKKHSSIIKAVFVTLACVLVFSMIWYLFSQNDGQQENLQQSPYEKVNKNDTIANDTNNLYK